MLFSLEAQLAFPAAEWETQSTKGKGNEEAKEDE